MKYCVFWNFWDTLYLAYFKRTAKRKQLQNNRIEQRANTGPILSYVTQSLLVPHALQRKQWLCWRRRSRWQCDGALEMQLLQLQAVIQAVQLCEGPHSSAWRCYTEKRSHHSCVRAYVDPSNGGDALVDCCEEEFISCQVQQDGPQAWDDWGNHQDFRIS